MSDYVWVSNIQADSSLTRFMNTDLPEPSVEEAKEGFRVRWHGKPAPANYCPNKIWAKEIHETRQAMGPKYAPAPLFEAGGRWIMCSAAADIFRRFDLGGGALCPVREGVWAPDPTARDPDNWFCWIFGNAKKAFSESNSPSAPGVDGPQFRDECALPWKMTDDVIAVSTEALSGPDVWVDRTLFKSVFLSRELGDALDAEGFREAFRLYRARVI
jgi:hypothetical protein